MAKSKQPVPTSANLTEQQKRAAIVKIERKIKKLAEFDVNTINQQSESLVLSKELETLLSDIFGYNTVEYDRYQDIAYLGMSSINIFQPPSILEVRHSISASIKKAINVLTSIMDGFNEDLSDAELYNPSRILRAYNGLQLHDKIADAANKLFRDGHYANAIEDASKCLINMVKHKSGYFDKDNAPLMLHVFSANNPLLKVSTLPSPSDYDEQLGFMNLFVGAIQAFRNPRAHLLLNDEPERALECIAFISFLAKIVDESNKI